MTHAPDPRETLAMAAFGWAGTIGSSLDGDEPPILLLKDDSPSRESGLTLDLGAYSSEPLAFLPVVIDRPVGVRTVTLREVSIAGRILHLAASSVVPSPVHDYRQFVLGYVRAHAALDPHPGWAGIGPWLLTARALLFRILSANDQWQVIGTCEGNVRALAAGAQQAPSQLNLPETLEVAPGAFAAMASEQDGVERAYQEELDEGRAAYRFVRE